MSILLTAITVCGPVFCNADDSVYFDLSKTELGQQSNLI